LKLALATFTICVFLLSGSAVAQQRDVRSWTAAFLQAYANADSVTVLHSVDENTTVYGSDAAEVFHGQSGIKSMLANDARLWGGKAHIGEMQDISIAQAGDIATIFFNASFAVGDLPSVPVRFCIVWKRSKTGWYLVQSSSAVVTDGQSAQAILMKNTH